MNKKRWAAVCLALCLLLTVLCSCANEKETAPVLDAASSSAGEASVAEKPEEEQGNVPEEEPREPTQPEELTWTLENQTQSFQNEAGAEVYYTQLDYPVFQGRDAELLNAVLEEQAVRPFLQQEPLMGYESGEALYQDYLESMSQEMLDALQPFYDFLALDEVYVGEKVVSVGGMGGFWSGGAHPYTYRQGLTVSRSTGELLDYTDLLKKPEQFDQLVRQYGRDTFTVEQMERDYAPESFQLTEDGLHLWFNVGDALPREEVVIPGRHLILE